MNYSNLDRNFSTFIRLRDSKNGYITCISCGKILPWKKSDCGHFVNRRNMNLRYSEKNCNAQCRECNRFYEGNASGYALGLIKKYGVGIIEELNLKKNIYRKFTQVEIDALNKYYIEQKKQYEKR